MKKKGYHEIDMKNKTHLPVGRVLEFVDSKNIFLKQARDAANTLSLDPQHPTGAVLVKDGVVIGVGANGSSFHERVGCVRKFLNIKSGTGYWMCAGCATKNHAEQKAICNAKQKGQDTDGADIYLWGHSYCCQWCWKTMIDAGIKNVYLEKK